VRTTLRWLGTIAAALLCVVAVGACGGEDDGAQPLSNEKGDDDEGGDGDDGAPPLSNEEADDDEGGDGGGDGGDGGGDGGGVPGAPIDIPAFTIGVGQPLDAVLPDIEGTITELCGGEMCLVLRIERRDNDIGATECDFVDTDPPEGGQVERGGTLIVIVGTQPCTPPGDGNDGDDGDSGDGGDGDDGTDDEPTDDEPTDDEPTDDEPTDDTETTTEGTP